MQMIKMMLFLLAVAVLGLARPLPAAAAEKLAEEKEPKKAILVVSFGTSVPRAEKGITNLVDAAKKAFPGYEVRLAYTSNIIRRKIAAERKIDIPTPLEALAKLQSDGFTTVYAASTHLIPGEEYNDVRSVVRSLGRIEGKYAFKIIKMSKPFLADMPHCELMADLLLKRFAKELSDKNNAIVLMGHGSPEHFSHALYAQLQLFLDMKAPSRFFIGTVERAPDVETIVGALKKSGKNKVILSPLMIVAGDHAINDMADQEDEESWYSVLKAAGFRNISVRQEGLGEDPMIAAFFVENIKELID